MKKSASSNSGSKGAPAKSAPAKSAASKAPSKSAMPSGKPGNSGSPKSNSGKPMPSGAGSKTSSSRAGGKTPPKKDAAAGLRELFIDELKDIYWAEKALTKALPKMAKNSTSPDLMAAIQDHLAVTQNQVTRLEQVFSSLGEKAQAKKCEAMAGLVKEGEEIIESTEPGVVRDAGIISACQKVEHYEIATYGTLAAFAKTLGENEAMSLLSETLEEEKQADSSLSDLAESEINIEAADEDDDGEENSGKNGSKNSSGGKTTPPKSKGKSGGKSSNDDDDDA